MTTALPGYDVYLSYREADRDVVRELSSLLESAGLRVWSDLDVRPGSVFEAEATPALKAARFVAVCVGASGLGQGQLRELTLVEARAAEEPDVRFAAVLLPGLPAHFSGSSLPLSLQARIWLDLRDGISRAPALIGQIVGSPQTEQPEAPAETWSASPSVSTAAGRLSGEVTGAAFVTELLRLHPEYGERRAEKVQLDRTAGELATADEWLRRVRARLKPGDGKQQLHGRLLIAGLARVDPALKPHLEVDGFLPALEREIKEPLDALFVDEAQAPEETVPTHADNPATVDLLNREGFGRILAARIVDAREQDAEASAASPDGKFPKGRSFLVLLHGRWGSGKTSVLNFLHDDLRERYDPPWVVVTFNAWQHQRLAPPWWWLATSLYQGALRELSTWRGLKLRGREWLWRLKGGWMLLAALVVLAALFVLIWQLGLFATSGEKNHRTAFEAFRALVLGTAAILTPLLVIWGVVRGASRWFLTTSARGARFYVDHAQDPMQTTKEHFAKLVDWIESPLLITIDDLDRCQPQFVVELLEGIQTLFRDVPVAYVIAADREWLAECYARQYDSFAGTFTEPGRPLGYLFLEKTFQMTLAIPALNTGTRDAYWTRLIGRPVDVEDHDALEAARSEAGEMFRDLKTEEDVRGKLAAEPGSTLAEQQARIEAAAIQLASPKNPQAAEHALSSFQPLLDANPRAMKRLVNAYGIGRGLELMNRGTVGWDQEAQHRMALWALLSLRWPRLSEHFAEHPDDAAPFFNGGRVPGGVPKDLAPLFADPGVRAVMHGTADGIEAKLDPDAIRLCVST